MREVDGMRLGVRRNAKGRDEDVDLREECRFTTCWVAE